MTGQEGGAKELFHTIVTHPALLVAVLFGAGLIVYFLVRNSPQGQGTSSNGSYSAGSADLQTLLNYGYSISPPVTSGVPNGGVSPTPTPIPTPTPAPPAGLPPPEPTPVPQLPVLGAPPRQISTPTPAPVPQRTYTVVYGDTLSGIASRFGTTWQNLYSRNQQTIDTTSAQHGNPIPGGPWNNIFPGEVLTY